VAAFAPKEALSYKISVGTSILYRKQVLEINSRQQQQQF